jgi:Uma2 family endonuclease
MATKTLLTIEQIDQLPERDDVIYELDDGELITMARPLPRHNLVRECAARHIGNFVENRHLGRVLVVTEFVLSKDTVRIPDIAFLTSEQMSRIDLDQLIRAAPSLTIEVVSPNDRAEELARTVDQYLAAGSKAVWVIYPQVGEVHIFRAGGVTVLRGVDAVLEDQEILPGFSLPLAALFE